MKTDLLRKYLLQLAVQGKLVPQQTSEGTAQDLVDNIREEKAVLVSEKKLKKDPKESYIYRDEEGHFMERIGKQEPVCIDENLPFAVPEGWTWARLGEICEYNTNTNVNVLDIPDEAWILELEDLETGTAKILNYRKKSNSDINGVRKMFCKDDVLFSKLRTYLNKVLVAPQNGYCTTEIVPIRFYGGISSTYMCQVLRSSYSLSYSCSLGYGLKMPRLGTSDACSFLLPLPPLAEQARIVKKMEELQKELEEMDASRTDMKKRCDLTRKMILQQAIKGALVPQQTSEGTAQDLVDNIREEKAVLVSEKKLKKDPKESYIYRDEEGHFMERIGKQEPVCIDNDLPFAVPEGWTWARLGEINTYESQLINPNLFPDDIYELYSVPTFNTGEPEYVKGKSVGSSKQSVQKNDVLISKINPHINRVWKVFKKSSYINVASSEWIVFRNSRVDSDYLRLYFSAPYFRTMLQSQVSGVGGSLMRAKPEEVKKYFLPLPPLAEQARIVKKVEELLEELDEMEKAVG